MKKSDIVSLLALASFIPVWRSGNRTGLTLWGFVINHTIFGPPVEYVPEEDYISALSSSVVSPQPPYKGFKLV
jgi:hypothetical protein